MIGPSDAKSGSSISSLSAEIHTAEKVNYSRANHNERRNPPQKLVFGRILHEMTTAQESESGSHFDRDVRSIVVGVEYATASGHVSQSKRGSGAADSSTGCGRRPDIKRAALSRAGDRRAFGSLAHRRSPNHSGLVHAPGSHISRRCFFVHFLGLPPTWGRCIEDQSTHYRYTGRHWAVRGGRLFCGCKALWKAQVGGRTPAR